LLLFLACAHGRGLAPIWWPSNTDSVRHLPPAHNRHSPAAPELPRITSGMPGVRLPAKPAVDQAGPAGGGSMPAPQPLTARLTSSRPRAVMRQSSCHATFSTNGSRRA
jgi:hypothetical protein